MLSAINSNVENISSALPILLQDTTDALVADAASPATDTANTAAARLKCRRPRSEMVDRLSLHSNRIRRIDNSISQMFPRLRYLDLSSNMIERIECLSALPYLEELNVSNNLVRLFRRGFTLIRLIL